MSVKIISENSGGSLLSPARHAKPDGEGVVFFAGPCCSATLHPHVSISIITSGVVQITYEAAVHEDERSITRLAQAGMRVGHPTTVLACDGPQMSSALAHEQRAEVLRHPSEMK